MKSKLLVIAILLLGIISMCSVVAAVEYTDVFERGQYTNLSFSCIDQFTDLPCDTTYGCNVTVYYPNGTYLLQNATTSRNNDDYTINLPDTNTLGQYKYRAYCTNETDSGTSNSLYYLVTSTGTQPTIAQGIIYLITLTISVLILFGLLYGAITIPYRNIRSPDGFIIGINTMKYLKIWMWFLSYIFLVWISYILWNVAEGFLDFGIVANMFRIIFLFFAWGIFIVTPATIFIFFLAAYKDSELSRMFKRGIFNTR